MVVWVGYLRGRKVTPDAVQYQTSRTCKHATCNMQHAYIYLTFVYLPFVFIVRTQDHVIWQSCTSQVSDLPVLTIRPLANFAQPFPPLHSSSSPAFCPALPWLTIRIFHHITRLSACTLEEQVAAVPRLRLQSAFRHHTVLHIHLAFPRCLYSLLRFGKAATSTYVSMLQYTSIYIWS